MTPEKGKKNITVRDGLVITDQTSENGGPYYFLFADILDKTTVVILKFHFDPKWDEENPQDHALRHVRTIEGIPGKAGILSNLILMNFEAKEAEQQGLLHPPKIIDHDLF